MTSLTSQQEEILRQAIGHEVMIGQVRALIFNLTGRFPGESPFPGKPSAMPIAGGSNLTDKVYTVVDTFARSVAASCFSQSWSWSDFNDGWRKRFADSAADDALAWGVEGQIGVAIAALVETGLMRQSARAELGLVRYHLLKFVSHLVQALRMYMIGHDPGLLAMTEEEFFDLMRRLHGD